MNIRSWCFSFGTPLTFPRPPVTIQYTLTRSTLSMTPKNRWLWDVAFAWSAILAFCGVFWWMVISGIIHVLHKRGYL